MATLSPDELNEALRPLRLMLGAEGYGLDITADPLEIRISATDSACAECLVPRTVMEPMIADMMQRSGLEGDYALRYPESHVDACGQIEAVSLLDDTHSGASPEP